MDFGCDAHCSTLRVTLCSTQLDLRKNQIGDAGAAELAEALAINRTLTEVCLAWHAAT